MARERHSWDVNSTSASGGEQCANKKKKVRSIWKWGVFFFPAFQKVHFYKFLTYHGGGISSCWCSGSTALSPVCPGFVLNSMTTLCLREPYLAPRGLSPVSPARVFGLRVNLSSKQRLDFSAGQRPLFMRLQNLPFRAKASQAPLLPWGENKSLAI